MKGGKTILVFKTRLGADIFKAILAAIDEQLVVPIDAEGFDEDSRAAVHAGSITHDDIQQAILIHIAKRADDRTANVTTDAGLGGDVGEGAVAVVLEEMVGGAEAEDEQVVVAIIVSIAVTGRRCCPRRRVPRPLSAATSTKVTSPVSCN